MRIAHGDAKCGITTATLVLALIVISLARPANGQDQQLVAIRVAQFEFHGSGLTGSRGHIVVSGPGGMEEAVGALVQHAEVRGQCPHPAHLCRASASKHFRRLHATTCTP